MSGQNSLEYFAGEKFSGVFYFSLFPVREGVQGRWLYKILKYVKVFELNKFVCHHSVLDTLCKRTITMNSMKRAVIQR